MSAPYKIILAGRPASKKNSRKAIRHSATGKILFIPGKSYAEFREQALWQLKHTPQFTGPVVVDYIFKRQGKYPQDVDNAIASINDVLQDAGVIDDDKNIQLGSYFVSPGHHAWTTIVYITPREGNEIPRFLDHIELGMCEIIRIAFDTGHAVVKPYSRQDGKLIEVPLTEAYTPRL